MAKPKLSLTRRVIHVELPSRIWMKFASWCIEQGHSSLTAGVKDLIKEKVK